jgi:hypothetical protein
MFPVIEESRDLTAVCAPTSEHGAVLVHAVPEPVGEAYRVLIVAAVAEAVGMSTMPAVPSTSAVAAPIRRGRGLECGRLRCCVTIPPQKCVKTCGR